MLFTMICTCPFLQESGEFSLSSLQPPILQRTASCTWGSAEGREEGEEGGGVGERGMMQNRKSWRWNFFIYLVLKQSACNRLTLGGDFALAAAAVRESGLPGGVKLGLSCSRDYRDTLGANNSDSVLANPGGTVGNCVYLEAF